MAQATSLRGEWLFALILHAWVQYGNVHDYFLSCSAVYVGALALASYRIFGGRWFIPFLTACAMFTFWVYGVNGIRNGMAASVMILGLSFRDNLKYLVLFSLLAVSLHKSMVSAHRSRSLRLVPDRYPVLCGGVAGLHCGGYSGRSGHWGNDCLFRPV